MYNNRWIRKFLRRARETCEDVHCGSRRVGCVLVKDKIEVSSGYNGPPPGCRLNVDSIIDKMLPYKSEKSIPYYDSNMQCVVCPNPISSTFHTTNPSEYFQYKQWKQGKNICPRKLLSAKSGANLHVCTCNHAESNAIAFAARQGLPTLGCSCFTYPISPCKTCAGMLVSAGITEIYTIESNNYDDVSMSILNDAGVSLYQVAAHLLDANPTASDQFEVSCLTK